MEEEKQLYTIILRHDTSTMWLVNDPILALGEYGVEDDTHKIKRGNGESKWSELTYEDFGLQYIVTFANLGGEVSDNEALQKILDEKVSVKVFDDTNNSVITGIGVIDDSADEDDYIARITRTTKNLQTNATISSNLIVKSEDNTVQGYWSTDSKGNRILNIIAVCSITDYQPAHRYYKDQLCYFNNKVYRAYRDIDSDKSFNEGQWVLLCSLHSSDIKYDNLVSGLDAENVKDALDELKRRDDRKVQKSTEERIVYGTDTFGNQIVIPIDDLRKVDTVNHKKADLSKNVQLDASEINYSDADPSLGTIRKVLDSKVDKTFAGEGAKIVRDIEFNYNDIDGTIELVEDKVSPETGESSRETRTIDIVSEKELAKNVADINERIDNEVETLNTRIDDEVETLNIRVDEEVETLNTRITDEVEELNATIETNKQEINTRVDNEVATLNTTIENNKQEINTRVNNEVATLNSTIETNKEEINTKVDTIKEETDKTIADNKQEINDRVDEEVNTLNSRIDEEVATLNESIATERTAINNRVDNEVADLNETIDLTKTELNNKIDENDEQINTKVDTIKEETDKTISDNKADIEQKLVDGLNTKIDKDISTNILIDIVAAQQSQEPTLKLTRKNTETKEPIVNHIHFKAVGNIETKFGDGDHIIIDSSAIDELLSIHTTKLEQADTRLTGHDREIAALEAHDVNHDTMLANHAEQLVNHETRMLNLETRADGFDRSILDLDAKIEQETTNRKVADAKLETDISRNALNIENNTKAIRDNADNIIELNDLLQENVTNLTQKKVDKTFAALTDNKVVGNIIYTTSGNELLDIEKQNVSPVDGSLSSSNFKIYSTDNTLVATPVLDDNNSLIGIDLATNLDTDVNYFVTTEILDTTIPSSNIISLSSLTPTDKVNVELYDIISDSEGTWARVSSINEEDNTCTAITFHKHAQAVWGTVKGNIAEQADLQAELAKKVTLQGPLNTNILAMITPGTNNTTRFEWGAIHVNPSTGKVTTTTQLLTSSDNSITINGSSTQSGNSITEMKAQLSVQAENVVFDPKTSGLTSVRLAWAIRELKTISDTNLSNLETKINDTKTSLNELIVNTESVLSNRIEEVNSSLSTEIENLDNDKLSKTDKPSMVYGTDEDGNQYTYGVDEFGKVDTVNNKVPDENKNIELMGSDIVTNEASAQTVAGDITNIYDIVNSITSDLATVITAYVPDTFYYATSTYTTQRFVTFEREDSILLMAKIMKDFTATTMQVTDYDAFMYDVGQGNLKLVGIPEQVGGGDTPTPEPTHTGDTLVTTTELASDLVAAVSYNSATGATGPKYVDITNNSSTSMTVLSPTWEMENNIVDSGETITATNNDETLVATEIDSEYVAGNFTAITTEEYGTDVMNTLNEVDGNVDTYDSLGGTEAEISAVLDEILGN